MNYKYSGILITFLFSTFNYYQNDKYVRYVFMLVDTNSTCCINYKNYKFVIYRNKRQNQILYFWKILDYYYHFIDNVNIF